MIKQYRFCFKRSLESCQYSAKVSVMRRWLPSPVYQVAPALVRVQPFAQVLLIDGLITYGRLSCTSALFLIIVLFLYFIILFKVFILFTKIFVNIY